MTALYRSARRVDALRVFTTVRNRLTEDIGVEPGPRLAELQASILAADPALADNELGESRPGLNLGVTSEPSVMPRGGRDHGAERDGRGLSRERLIDTLVPVSLLTSIVEAPVVRVPVVHAAPAGNGRLQTAVTGPATSHVSIHGVSA